MDASLIDNGYINKFVNKYYWLLKIISLSLF